MIFLIYVILYTYICTSTSRIACSLTYFHTVTMYDVLILCLLLTRVLLYSLLYSDGQKMSKRLKNYPDPVAVVHKYGADALRLYLINSPVVRAESLRFKEGGVKDVVKDVFLPWFNAYRFLMQNVARLKEVRK